MSTRVEVSVGDIKHVKRRNPEVCVPITIIVLGVAQCTRKPGGRTAPFQDVAHRGVRFVKFTGICWHSVQHGWPADRMAHAFN